MSTPLKGSFAEQLRSRLSLYALNNTSQDDSHNSIFTLMSPGIPLNHHNFNNADEEDRSRLESNLFNQYIPWSDYSYQDGTLISDRYLQAIDSVVIKPDEGLQELVTDLTKATTSNDADVNGPNQEVVQTILSKREASVSKDVRFKMQYSTIRTEQSPKNGLRKINNEEKDDENCHIAYGDDAWWESLSPDLTLPIIPYDIESIAVNVQEYLEGLKTLVGKLKNILSRFAILGFSFDYTIDDFQNTTADYCDIYQVFLSFLRDKNNVLNQNEFIYSIGKALESKSISQFEEEKK